MRFEEIYEVSGTSSLGNGGMSLSIQRCRLTGLHAASEQGSEFAVKAVSRSRHNTAATEAGALALAADRNVRRVVRLIEAFLDPAGESRLILELVPGDSLDVELAASLQHGEHASCREDRMLQIAAQLIQTLDDLHCDACLAHMDVSPGNIIMQRPGAAQRQSDQLRLIDFGLAAYCDGDMAVMDVLPNGAKVMYASPELLRSLQLQLESSDSEYILVSGPGCDVWSSAVMLYQCFIGEFPFVPEDTDDSAAAPCHIRGRRRKLWVQYESMLAAQQSWVDACASAAEQGKSVQHALLDKLRHCSSNPSAAVSFFSELLSPVAQQRPPPEKVALLPYLQVATYRLLPDELQLLGKLGADCMSDQGSLSHSDTGTCSATSSGQDYSSAPQASEGLDESQVYNRVPQLFKSCSKYLRQFTLQVGQAIIRPVSQVCNSPNGGSVQAETPSAAAQRAIILAPTSRQSTSLGQALLEGHCDAQQGIACHAVDFDSDNEDDDSPSFQTCVDISSQGGMASGACRRTVPCHAISDFDEDDLVDEAAEEASLAATVSMGSMDGQSAMSASPHCPSVESPSSLHQAATVQAKHSPDSAEPARQEQPFSMAQEQRSGRGRWLRRSRDSLQSLGKGLLLAGAAGAFLGVGLKIVSSSSSRGV